MNEKFYQLISKAYPEEDIKILVYGAENFTKTLPASMFSLNEIIKDMTQQIVEKVSFCPHQEKYTRFLVLDIDFKGVSDEVKKQILDKILLSLRQEANIKHNAIVDSGTGYHVYYLFDRLPITKYYLLINMIKTVLQKKDLLNFVDKKSFSLNAYFRLPGVVNTKRVGDVIYIDETKVKVGDIILDIDEVVKNPEKYGVLVSKVIDIDDSFENQIDDELLNEYKQLYINSTRAFVFDINSLDKENLLSIDNIKAFYKSAARMKNRVSDQFWEKIYYWFENGGLIKKGERHNCLIRIGLSMTYWFGRELAEKFLKNEKIFEDQENFYREERIEKLLDDWEKLCPNEPAILLRVGEGKDIQIFDYKEFFDNYVFIYSQPIKEVIISNSVDNVGFFIVYDNNNIKYLHRSMKVETIIENLIPVDYTDFGITLLEEAINYVKNRKTKNNMKINSMLLIRYLLKYLDEQDILIKEQSTSDDLEDTLIKTIHNIGDTTNIVVLEPEEYAIVKNTIFVKKELVKPLVILLEDRNKLCLNRVIMSSCLNDMKETLKKQISSNSGLHMIDNALKRVYTSMKMKTPFQSFEVDVLDVSNMKQLVDYVKLIAQSKKEETANDQ